MENRNEQILCMQSSGYDIRFVRHSPLEKVTAKQTPTRRHTINSLEATATVFEIASLLHLNSIRHHLTHPLDSETGHRWRCGRNQRKIFPFFPWTSTVASFVSSTTTKLCSISLTFLFISKTNIQRLRQFHIRITLHTTFCFENNLASITKMNNLN